MAQLAPQDLLVPLISANAANECRWSAGSAGAAKHGYKLLEPCCRQQPAGLRECSPARTGQASWVRDEIGRVHIANLEFRPIVSILWTGLEHHKHCRHTHDALKGQKPAWRQGARTCTKPNACRTPVRRSMFSNYTRTTLIGVRFFRAAWRQNQICLQHSNKLSDDLA